ncbi:HEAT repeat domain-containing protein [Candidatus Protochlamydia amoebophila]|uniref:HEAT repeat domain-containing protein n=1 Tax=Candidatus Protochlamydia amoebophila TaxID=362787 RepID=UPI001BC8CDB3|nr:HEAT repeat domain-containing protein [Candidatus Protochlamydia amoebophila]
MALYPDLPTQPRIATPRASAENPQLVGKNAQLTVQAIAVVHNYRVPAPRLSREELSKRLKDLLELKCPHCIEDLMAQGHKLLRETKGEASLHGVFYLATAYELCVNLKIQPYSFEALNQYLDSLEEKETLLHYFAAQENLSIFNYLFAERPSIKSQLDVLAGEVIKETPLHVAIRKGSIPIAQFLLGQGADIKEGRYGKHAMTVLHVAAEYRREEIFDLLLQHTDISEILNLQDENQYTALHLAAAKGNFSIAFKLINRNAHTELQDAFHLTPLEVLLEQESSVFKIQDKCAYILLGKKSPSFFQLDNPSLKTCFMNALKHGLPKAAKKLAEDELPQLEEQEPSFLEIAAERAFPRADALSSQPVEISQEKRDVYIDLIDWLLKEKKIDPNQKFKHRPDFLIHQVCYAGCSKLLSLLIDLKADLTIRDSSQNNALHFACCSPRDCVDIVRILLGNCPSLMEAKNSDERSPLHLAALAGNEQSVQFLLNQPAHQIKLDQQDKDGNTPLHLAVIEGEASLKARDHYCNIIEELVKKGVNLNILNHKKQTALALASKNGNEAITEALVQAALNPQYLVNSLRNLYLSQETLSIFRVKTNQDWEFKIPLKKIYVRLGMIEKQERITRDQTLIKHSDCIQDERIPTHCIQDERIPTHCIQDERIPTHETIFEPKKNIEIEELFKHTSLKEAKSKRVYIQGAAGIGKSTLCHYIAYRWAKQDLWQDLFSCLFWIPLRNFTLEKYPANHDYTPVDLIARECAGKINREVIEACINDAAFRAKTLLVLDGYDELSSEAQANNSLAKAFKGLKELFPHILITSRPGSCSFDRSCELELLGFDKKGIDLYIDKFFKKVQPEDKKTKLQSLLKSSPNVSSLAHIPINLTLLCCLFNEEPEFFDSNQPITMTSIYERMVNWMYKWFMLRQIDQGQSKGQTKEQILGGEDLRHNPKVRKFATAFEDIAFFAMQEDILYLEKKRIEEFIGKEEITLNEFTDCGLVRIPEAEKKGYFIHLTFQEFLTASKVANQYLDNSKKEMRQECQNFVRKYKFEPRYALVFRMIAGYLSLDSLSNRRYADARQFFFDDLFSAPQDLAVRSELNLIAGCFEECQNPAKVKQYDGFIELVKDYIKHLSLLGLDCERLLRNKNLLNHPKVAITIKELLVNPKTRKNTLRTLKKIIDTGQRLAPKIVGFIVEILQDRNGDSNDKRSAAYVLRAVVQQGGLPEDTLDALIKILEGGDSEGKRSAAYILREIVQRGGELPEDALAALIQILQMKPDFEAKRSAAWALGAVVQQGGEFAEKALTALIQIFEMEGNFEAKRSAAEVLGAVAKQRGKFLEDTLDALIKILEESDSEAKRHAAQALGVEARQGGKLPKKTLDALIKILKEGDFEGKRHAAQALGAVARQEGEFAEKALDALIKILEGSDSEAKRHATQAVGTVARQEGEFAEKTLDALIKIFKEGDSEAKRHAAQALGAVVRQEGEFSKKALKTLIKILEGSDSEAKRHAVQALGTVARQEGEFAEKTLDALIKILKEGDSEAKRHAAQALGAVVRQEGEFSKKALDALIQIIRMGDFDAKGCAAEALGAVAQQRGELPEEALATLIQILQMKPDFEAKRSAAWALGSVAQQGGKLPKEALDALIQIIQMKPASDAKRSAIQALRAVAQQGGEFSKEVLEALIQIIQMEGDFDAKSYAAEALGAVARQGIEVPKEALTALIQIIRMGDSAAKSSVDEAAKVSVAKYSAISALGEVVQQGDEFPKEALEALIQIIQMEGDFDAKSYAAEALGAVARQGIKVPKEALTALIQIIRMGDSVAKRSVDEAAKVSVAKYSAISALGEVAQQGGEFPKEALDALIQIIQMGGDSVAKRHAAEALKVVNKKALFEMGIEAFPLIAKVCFLFEDSFLVKDQKLQISDKRKTYFSENKLMPSYDEEIREKLPKELVEWRKRLDILSQPKIVTTLL